jgi:SWI/SNF-related matrix-associated actin-dependent regulator 1 of chromatin subfamily A
MMNGLDALMQGISTPRLAAQALGVDTTDRIEQVEMALPLFDYQRKAVDHALRDTVDSPWAYCALDMGLGKSPVGTCIIASAAAKGQVPYLAVVPPSLRINWVREARKFAPWLRLATIQGKDDKTGAITVHGPAGDYVADHTNGLPDVDMFIMGDSSVSGWCTYLSGVTEEDIIVHPPRIVGLVVDEAHRFKNKSQRGAALKRLGSKLPGMRVLMSGTPMPNGRHNELASQIDVLGPGAWKDIGGIGTFWNWYCPKTDQWGGRGNHDSEGLHKAMTSTWFFRRLRDQVIDLPAKGRTSVALEGKGRAVGAYKRAEDDLIEYLKGRSNNGQVTPGQRRAKALLKITTLRMLAGEAKIASAVEHIKDILDNEPGGVFVVAEHTNVIDGLLAKLLKYNPTYITGGMSDKQKAEMMDDFNSGESRVMVGQITAAGVGLTLHGDGKNHRVVVVQLPWTPADLRQAEDRLHRIGQTHDVMVEVALCAIEGRWTIDERLWGLLETKHFNTTSTVDGEGEFLLEAVQEGVLDSYRS